MGGFPGGCRALPVDVCRRFPDGCRAVGVAKPAKFPGGRVHKLAGVFG